VSVPALHTETTVNIQLPSFRPATSTWFVVLTWQRDASRLSYAYMQRQNQVVGPRDVVRDRAG